jgi:uncharacterized protein
MLDGAHVIQVAGELGLKVFGVEAVAKLLAGDATVPFIARYRKEVTGSLDEVAVMAIRDRLVQLKELDTRRLAIEKSLGELGKLSDELKVKLAAAGTMAELEDIYLPYRPKRRTRATMAKEKGLEPLAEVLLEQRVEVEPMVEGAKFVDEEKGVATVEDAIAGARDIIAERISEEAEIRSRMRELFMTRGEFVTKVMKGKEEEGAKYENYFEWKEAVAGAPSHRVLAMRRGAKEGFLSLRIVCDEEAAVGILRREFVLNDSACAAEVENAAADCYKRLLWPAMETEVRMETKKRADGQAIGVFSENLRQLLLAPALGGKNVMAIDPGFRTGCKVVCLTKQGGLVHTDVIYPHQENRRVAEAEKVRGLCAKYSIEAVAIGNGTAGRETEAFVRAAGLGADVTIVMVNESGASIYSASETAREEFGEYDLTVRGAVSIGRRLMDPLAELVKIDAKSIGVGQYQHDVDQNLLKQGLDDVVVSCVNSVGVEVNTASKELLSYVSGLGRGLGAKVVEYRNEHGAFSSRAELKKVARLGAKAFEQAAGFLRIRGAANVLDASAVHPESYHIVDSMAADMECSVEELMRDAGLRGKIDVQKYVGGGAGVETLSDIMAELAKPGRDPRKEFSAVKFAEGVDKIEQVSEGMVMTGVVTNVTAFGAFVDIGVHQDGLVHISEMADRFVKDPADVVKLGQEVKVRVLGVDLKKRQIKLSMKKEGGEVRDKSAGKKKEKRAVRERPKKQEDKGGDEGGRLIDRLTFGS